MNNTFFTLYKRAIDLNLSNDLITKFKKDLHNFKKIYREKYLSIKNLQCEECVLESLYSHYALKYAVHYS